MSFTTLHNVALPLKTQRLDDVAEYLMDAAETQANQAPDPNSTKAKLRRLGLPAIFDLSHDQSSNAIDLITQAIAQTTEITKHEADPVVLSERWKIIERYLPHSLQPTITTLKQAAKDQNGLSMLALLTEETIFNLQFGRVPPILTPWAFRELTQTVRGKTGSYQYQKVGMVSTFSVKVANTLSRRLAGTSVLRNLCHTVTDLTLDTHDDNVRIAAAIIQHINDLGTIFGWVKAT